MEVGAFKNAKNQERTLPPRRGLIKIRIIKSLITATSSFTSKKNKDGDGSSGCPSPITPAVTSGYNSDYSPNS